MERDDGETFILTKKELDESAGLGAKLWPFILILARILQPVMSIGFVKRSIERTTANRIGQSGRYAESGKHVLAANLAIEWLRENRHETRSRGVMSVQDRWWFFMDLATRSLAHGDDHEKWDEVIGLGRNGPEPFRGYFVARSFAAFSRRMCKTENYAEAVEFAERASRADETWADPDFLLGWYALVLGGSDPMEHLTRAVEKDPGIVFRIAQDSVCRNHPHIIQKLKELTAEQAAGSAT